MTFFSRAPQNMQNTKRHYWHYWHIIVMNCPCK